MFGIGWAEMLVIGLVALIVVGPDKLPEMARTIGKIYHQLRQAATEAGQTISAEVELLNAEASKALDGLDKDLPKAVLGHPDLEELRKAVKPQSLFAGNPAAPVAENPIAAGVLEKKPTAPEPSPAPSPAPTEVAADARPEDRQDR